MTTVSPSQASAPNMTSLMKALNSLLDAPPPWYGNMSKGPKGYGQAQTFWEMHPNFQRFSPKLKVTTFLSRPAKLNYKSNDFFTSASQAGWLGNCRKHAGPQRSRSCFRRTYDVLTNAFGSDHHHTPPSSDHDHPAGQSIFLFKNTPPTD